MAISTLAATGWRRGDSVRVVAMGDFEDISMALTPGLARAADAGREATA